MRFGDRLDSGFQICLVSLLGLLRENNMWYIGLLMYMLAGLLLHDVPFIRFVPAMILISVGTILNILGDKL